MLLLKGMGLTGGMIYKAVYLSASLLVISKILLEKHSALEWTIILALFFTAILVWAHSGNQGVFWTVLMCLSMKGIDVSRAFRYGGFVWGSCFFVQFCIHLLGIANFDYVVHNKWGMGHTIRWAMGYTHPNVMQISYAVFIMLFFFSYVKKNNLRKYVVLALLGWLYTFMYSLSVTGTVMLFVFLLLYMCWYFRDKYTGNKKKNSWLLKLLLECILPFSVLFAIVAPLILQGRSFDLLNKAFQTRPYLSRTIWNACGVHMFGTDYSGMGRNFTLDCSYMNLLIGGGWISFAEIMTLYTLCIHYLLWKAKDSEKWKDIIIILTVVIAAISEPFAFNTSFKNISLFIVGARLFQILHWKKEFGLFEEDNYWFAACDNEQRYCTIRGLDIGERMSRDKKYRVLITAITVGLVLAAIAYKETSGAVELYGSRRYFDDIENYPEEYLDESQIAKLSTDPNVRILDYRGPSEAMVHFSENETYHIDQVEKVRAATSAFVAGVLIVYVGGCFMCGKRDRKHENPDRQ